MAKTARGSRVLFFAFVDGIVLFPMVSLGQTPWALKLLRPLIRGLF